MKRFYLFVASLIVLLAGVWMLRIDQLEAAGNQVEPVAYWIAILFLAIAGPTAIIAWWLTFFDREEVKEC